MRRFVNMLFSTKLCSGTVYFCRILTLILHFHLMLPYLYRNSPHKEISADYAQQYRSRIYRGAYRRSLVILACIEVAGKANADTGGYKAYRRYNRKNDIVPEMGAVSFKLSLPQLYKQGKRRPEKRGLHQNLPLSLSVVFVLT